MADVSLVQQKDTTANPAPLGLLAFGMTTVLLNLHNAGFYELNSMILAMGIFYGGLAQVLAGYMEWKKNNTFGATAFTAYGFFWIALVAIWTLPKLGLAAPADPVSMGWFLLIWGVFTFLMFLGTLRLSVALGVVFGTLTILFVLLALGDWTDIAALKLYAGWVGILCGASAFYASLAQVLNEVYGRTVLPLGARTPH